MSDILKDLTNYRIKGIEKAEIEYYKQLTQTLDRIEAQIISLADQQLPRTAGKLIELQSAVAIRPKIKAILDKEYLPFADRVVRKGFGEQAKRVERQFKTIGLIPPEFQELTKGDLALVQNLKKQYYTQFKDVSNNFTRILSDKVYQNTLVGTEFTVLEKELRESINGIYATSSDPAVNRLVDYVKNNKGNPALASRVDAAVKILQTKYASTRVGENMKRYAGQILNDSLRDFDATLNFNKAKDAGLTYVKYYGDVIPTTRSHCRNMINGVYDRSGKGIYTIADITRIWNSNPWKGKKSGTPMVVRGGYNCRHQFSYVNPDWYEEDGEQSDILKEATPIIKKESKVNVSSYLNPIALANIRTVPLKTSQARIAKSNKKGFDDERYPRDENGNVLHRYKGWKSIGKTVVTHLDDKLATQISLVMEELNDLAVQYKVPPLRGFYSNIRQSSIASMGDGVLNVNPNKMRFLETEDMQLAYYSRKTGKSKEFLKEKFKNHKLNDPIGYQPFGSENFFDNELDKLRSVMYHEFGHHVHQMRYVNRTTDWKYGFKPEVEKKLKEITGRISATRYGESSATEWFAENFSLYTMGRTDLADPKFIKLIEEIAQ